MIQNSRFFAMVVETYIQRCLKMKTIANWQQKCLAAPAFAVSAIGLTFVEQLKQLISAYTPRSVPEVEPTPLRMC